MAKRKVDIAGRGTFLPRGEQPRLELRFANVDGRLVCVSLEIGAHVEGDELVLEKDEQLERLTTGRLRRVNLTSAVDEYLLALTDKLMALSPVLALDPDWLEVGK